MPRTSTDGFFYELPGRTASDIVLSIPQTMKHQVLDG
jgi:hypothetical protein